MLWIVLWLIEKRIIPYKWNEYFPDIFFEYWISNWNIKAAMNISSRGGGQIEGFFNTNARTCGFINFKEESSGKTEHGDKKKKKKTLAIIK